MTEKFTTFSYETVDCNPAANARTALHQYRLEYCMNTLVTQSKTLGPVARCGFDSAAMQCAPYNIQL